MTKNDVDIKKLMVEDYIIPESEFDRKRTKTSHFLLNTVFPNSTLTATEYFVNAFIDDAEFKHFIARPIFLLFKVKEKDLKWEAIAQRLRAKSEYVLEYFVGTQNNKNLIVMIFQVPEKYINEYVNFRTGAYSKFSDTYKKLFPRYTHNEKAQPVESTIWRVIHKSDILKKELEKYWNISATSKIGEPVVFQPEDELWGIPEPKFEIYRHQPKKKDE